jgi:hypothetical protein
VARKGGGTDGEGPKGGRTGACDRSQQLSNADPHPAFGYPRPHALQQAVEASANGAQEHAFEQRYADSSAFSILAANPSSIFLCARLRSACAFDYCWYGCSIEPPKFKLAVKRKKKLSINDPNDRCILGFVDAAAKIWITFAAFQTSPAALLLAQCP